MSNTDLDQAELANANMDNALSGAIVAGATGVSCHQAEGGKKGAKSLVSATVSNGQKYEDWLKGKEGCEE